MQDYISWSDFQKVDMRVGTIVDASPLPDARTPAYVLHIDFGTVGIKKSSAQITALYSAKNLIGTQIIAVINLAPKQVGKIMSECLVLGAVRDDGSVALITPDHQSEKGCKIR